jgi:hypothetical protein
LNFNLLQCAEEQAKAWTPTVVRNFAESNPREIVLTHLAGGLCSAALFCSAGFPACEFMGLSSPCFLSGGWKAAWTRKLESLRHIKKF